MPNASIKESERLGALRSLGLLDTAASEDFDQITRLAAYCFDAPIALISLVDVDRQQFLSRIGLSLKETPRETSICAHAIQNTEILEVEDLSQDPRFWHNPLVTGAPHMRFYAGTPLMTQSGHAIGALCIIDTRPRRLQAADREQLVALGKLVMNQVALRQSMGRRDVITGLPNRQQLVVDMDSMKAIGGAGQRRFALLEVLSLTDAQQMAQAVGLPAFESLLRHAVAQVKSQIPPHMELYQVGVTRLAFWFDATLDEGLLTRVTQQLHEPMLAGGVPIQLRVHCGLVDFDLLSAAPLDVLRQAMTSVNAAITSNETCSLYDPHGDANLQRQYQLAIDLKAAVERKEFHLVFQPRVDLHAGRVCAVEALIRWRHPQRGMISPAEFIPIVERTAMMQPLTLWVVGECLRHVAEWRRRFPELRASVNLSPRDFDNERLVPEVMRLCREYGVDAHCLEFEVTEGEWLRGSDSVVRQMNALIEAGATLAIDDFGAGYSNFAYMNQIPATVLKIDRSLVTDVVQDERHAVLVREILRLARSLNYRTIAEGVESAAVQAFVADCGCDEVQGYFFSRPLEAVDIPAFLQDFKMPDVADAGIRSDGAVQG